MVVMSSILTKKDLNFDPDAREMAMCAAEHTYKKYKGLTSSKMRAVINMREPSYRDRLYVYNIDRQMSPGAYLVAHGINSGSGIYATKFSNAAGSLCTSLGAYLTGATYIGKHGLSLHVRGLEPGINNNASFRDIEIHPAHYVSDTYVLEHGMCGHSEGCFAIDPATSDKLIDLIKDGVYLYVYY